MSNTDPAGEGAEALPGSNVVALAPRPTEQRPSEKVAAFVRKHPALTVAGGIALGVAVSALLPRRVRRRIVNKATGLAETAATASVALGRQMGSHAHDLGVDTRRQAARFAEAAEKAGDVAVHNLEKYGLAAAATAGTLGRAPAKRASRFGDAAADAAHRVGDVAADRSAKVLHFVEDLKKRT